MEKKPISINVETWPTIKKKNSCCIATIEPFRKTVQVRKFVANIGYNI